MRVRRNVAWRSKQQHESSVAELVPINAVVDGQRHTVRWHRAATRERQHAKPRGKPPMDAFGKPCTWGCDQGWLNSEGQPHTVVRNATRTALRAGAAAQRDGERQQLVAMRLERQQQAAEKRQQDKEQMQVEDEEREWRRQLKRQAAAAERAAEGAQTGMEQTSNNSFSC